jgi:hypothetical protein
MVPHCSWSPGFMAGLAVSLIALIPGSARAELLHGLTSQHHLALLDSNRPDQVKLTTINGLRAGETLLGLDTRPRTGDVFGLSNFGAALQGRFLDRWPDGRIRPGRPDHGTAEAAGGIDVRAGLQSRSRPASGCERHEPEPADRRHQRPA